MEIDLTEYTKFFIAMIAIVDPLAILPLYAQLTSNLSDHDKTRMARRVALATFAALTVALFLGQYILSFFGISIASFRIAGGLLLMIMAFQLIYLPMAEQVGGSESGTIDTQVVVPLAIPLLAGPGAFSTVIVFSFRNDTWWHYGLISACIVLLGLITWIALHMAGKILRHVSATGIAITVKVMGLIMAAIAVEFIANGVRALVTA
ncbi:MAG: NAAT family transporter [Pseudohongiellaceae bacterium]